LHLVVRLELSLC